MSALGFTLLLLATIVAGMIPRAIPILAAGIGETVSQNAGILNLGIEGYMLMGASVGFITDFYTHSILLAFFLAALSGMLFALFHAIASISFRADQIVSGTAIWFVGWGLSGLLYRVYLGSATSSPSIITLSPVHIPALSSIPYVGTLIFGEDPLAYLIIALVAGTHFFLYHTKMGLNLRTVGEDPKVAETAGVNPILYRYAATMFCGFLSGVGGAYLTLAVVGTFYYDITAGIGFIAVALVYFGRWRPIITLVGALIFGTVYVFYITIESSFLFIPYEFFAMFPYLATIFLIAIFGSRARPPRALARPYAKEA
jgi:ABC-type uncharacterized transport system permease subunit